jgi:hypothetical protein
MPATRRLHRRRRRGVAVLCALVTIVALPSFASARFFEVPASTPSPTTSATAPGTAPASAPTTVHEPSGYTLSIVLASAALLVAIVGSGYVAIRLRVPHHRAIRS